MLVVQRDLLLPSHHLGYASQHGVPAAPQVLRPPPPLQGAEYLPVRSGPRPGNHIYHRRAALLARGHLHLLEATGLPGLMRTQHQHLGLGRGTDAREVANRRAPHRLPLVTTCRLGGQDPEVQCFTLVMEDSRPMLIPPGETQSPPPSRLVNPKNLLLEQALPHPAPP